MALRAPVADSRRFASPALRALMSRRSAEFGGLMLGLLGLAILVALVFYDPRDPSLNTATTRRVTNLAGPGGAIIADVLLQGFGLAGALPGVTMLAWSWRIVSHGGLGSFTLRLAALLGAMPLLAAVLGAFPPPHSHWPVMAGLGGSIGQIIAHEGLALGASLFGVIGSAMVWILGKVANIAVGTVVTAGMTALDQLAWMLSRGAQLSVEVSSYIALTIAAIFRFLGRTMVAGASMTMTFIRWVLGLLYDALAAVARRALALVS